MDWKIDACIKGGLGWMVGEWSDGGWMEQMEWIVGGWGRWWMDRVQGGWMVDEWSICWWIKDE